MVVADVAGHLTCRLHFDEISDYMQIAVGLKRASARRFCERLARFRRVADRTWVKHLAAHRFFLSNIH